jgi:phenylacetate-CoA ligase
VNVFPSQIESVIMETRGVEPHYQLVVERVASLDQLTVLVEVNEKLFSDEIKNLQAMGRMLEKNIRETLGVAAEVKLVEPRTIQRSEGKAVRVVDKRKL